ncbi:hypothetical protein LX32DRAFT_178079 [Colletotrichum zoysiae]|uniref:Uncharacterized protein n=1 Tax=Colletotrichum zoysiae TaxID=1216348 RepID=A0AAD9H634_9PEZI|nr:hypothetical protein LX32DRAFT_178079 [Colletotrichum zoysiae]
MADQKDKTDDGFLSAYEHCSTGWMEYGKPFFVLLHSFILGLGTPVSWLSGVVPFAVYACGCCLCLEMACACVHLAYLRESRGVPMLSRNILMLATFTHPSG